MEKYFLLKLGMNLSEVEKVLDQKITLERYTHSPDSKNLFYVDYTIGTYLLFTEDIILESISFRYPFYVAVDGIKIGMNMNEVEKIKGVPEENVIYDKYSEMVEWHYYSKNITYLFIDNKVYEISFYNFDESYLTKDDIDTLVNAVSDFDKIDTSYFEITSNFNKLIENGDVVISSSFDSDKPTEN